MLIKKWGGTWWVSQIFGSSIIFGQSRHMQIADAWNTVKTEIKCPSTFTYIVFYFLPHLFTHILCLLLTPKTYYTQYVVKSNLYVSNITN